MTQPVIELTKQLISKKSISPNDEGCMELIIQRLKPLNFNIELIHYGNTTNLLAFHDNGLSGDTLLFAGHTDVVPAGDETQWNTPSFEPTIMDDIIYGRGAADMKSGVAAMTCAAESFIKKNPDHKGRIGFLLTSDEEADATDGTTKVVDLMLSRNEKIDYCIVGEPSSDALLGDQIKNGRRGSLTCNLNIIGIQGHVAYPQLAKNPIHDFAPALNELTSIIWDNGNDYFPATSMQIANINAGTGAENVIPGALNIQFNFRFSTELTPELIQNRVEQLLRDHRLDYTIHWRLSGMPFLTQEGKLTAAAISTIKEEMGLDSKLSTSGGTSDGRFIAKLGAQVIELGVLNKTIHKVNECCSTKDIIQLQTIYEKILAKLLVT